MLQTMFCRNLPTSCWKEDFKELTIYRHDSHLCHEARIILISCHFLVHLEAYIQNLVGNGLVVFDFVDELEDGHANRTTNQFLYHISYGG